MASVIQYKGESYVPVGDYIESYNNARMRMRVGRGTISALNVNGLSQLLSTRVSLRGDGEGTATIVAVRCLKEMAAAYVEDAPNSPNSSYRAALAVRSLVDLGIPVPTAFSAGKREAFSDITGYSLASIEHGKGKKPPKKKAKRAPKTREEIVREVKERISRRNKLIAATSQQALEALIAGNAKDIDILFSAMESLPDAALEVDKILEETRVA